MRPPRPSTTSSTELWNALIRTHHITSRKKIARLRQAAGTTGVHALLRTGGCPGIMYVEGSSEAGVREWVGCVARLRYKDYRLVAKVAAKTRDEAEHHLGQKLAGNNGRRVHDGAQTAGANGGRSRSSSSSSGTGLAEVASVKEFAARMDEMGVLGWWRRAMGFAGAAGDDTDEGGGKGGGIS